MFFILTFHAFPFFIDFYVIAAMEIYASPLLDNLDPDDNIFSKRFYRDSCTLNQELGCYVKDLNAVDDGENGNEFKRMV